MQIGGESALEYAISALPNGAALFGWPHHRVAGLAVKSIVKLRQVMQKRASNRELQTEFASKSRRCPKVRTAEEVSYEVPKYQSLSLAGGEVNRFRKQRPD
jgi:hypothetical protein